MRQDFQSWEADLNAQEEKLRSEMQKFLSMHRERPARAIQDYEVQTAGGAKKLSSLFGDKQEMLLIHNMGKKCNYCTLWADGLNGFAPHLLNRCALLLTNEDSLAQQAEMVRERGWTFPMASVAGTTLTEDLGFKSENGLKPGVSVVTRDAKGQLWQKTATGFGPGDIFCSQWSFIGLLPGDVDWEPKYKY